MSFYVSTATFFLLHCDEWDRVVALPRHKYVTGATLLQLGWYELINNIMHVLGWYELISWSHCSYMTNYLSNNDVSSA